MQDKEKVFVDGLIVKKPNPKAPDFVKMSISIKRKDLGNWLRSRDEEWINIDVKESKGGKWYAAVNDFKPENRGGGNPSGDAKKPDFDDDIPW